MACNEYLSQTRLYLFIYLFAVTPIWVKAKYIHSYKISERKKQNKQKKHNYMYIGTTEIRRMIKELKKGNKKYKSVTRDW
jgi:hypothetical protein